MEFDSLIKKLIHSRNNWRSDAEKTKYALHTAEYKIKILEQIIRDNIEVMPEYVKRFLKDSLI